MTDALPVSRELHLETLPLERVELGRTNVRRREITADIDELARSIDEIGQQQPIVVQPRNGSFEVLVGQRRYLALKKLGKPDVMALVPSIPFEPDEAVLISLSENIHRRDLEEADKAEAIALLYERYGTYSEVARRLGVSLPTVRKWVGYRAVPDALKEMVASRQITAPTAIKISQHIPDEERAVEMARYMAEHQPPAPERERILDAISDHADRPVETILERAREAQDVLRINFILSSQWARKMNRVATEERREASELARDATIEWLENQSS